MQLIIYFGNKPVYLCDEIDSNIHEILHHPDAVFIDELSTPAIKSLFHEIKKTDFHAGIIWHSDFDKLKKAFWKNFSLIQAAGGLVINEKGQVLMILRRGKWDLPKGKLDKGEKLEDCAIREVREETNLNKIKLNGKIAVTYHVYDEYGKHILKESHWYSMKGNSSEKLIPQTSEDIREIVWVEPDKLKEKLNSSFPSIIQVIQTAGLITDPSAE
jgi:8-oxo-dGTP pyrophosphatase MutT (NUDIX family)